MTTKTTTPSPESERLSDDVASGFDAVEATPAEAFVMRTEVLLNSPRDRNRRIWQACGAPVGIAFNFLATLPRAKQTGETNLAMQRIIAASQQQAYVETIARPHLKRAHKGAVATERTAKRMTKTQLREAATDGQVKPKIEAKRKARSQPDATPN